MSNAKITPCSVFFDTLKKKAGISYKETAFLILSNKSLSNNLSPYSRAEDRTWLSRYVVHAPIEAIHEGYFADFDKSALRVIARLKSSKKKMDNNQILEMIGGKTAEAMMSALKVHNDDVSTYGNVLERLSFENYFTLSERTEIAMVLFLTAACTASVKESVEYAMNFAHSIRGADVATPLITPNSQAMMQETHRKEIQDCSTLGLIRVIDNFIMGSPHWMIADAVESDGDRSASDKGEGNDPIVYEIGSLATGKNSISDVAADVSGTHLRIWNDDGHWYAKDCDSRNGSSLIDGASRESIVLAPPKKERKGDFEFIEAEIHPGDEIILGTDTHFMVVAGIPS